MQKNTPSDIDIYLLATEADESLTAIREALEQAMKEAGVAYFGKKSAAEYVYQVGRALAGQHPGVQRWLDGRKVRR